MPSLKKGQRLFNRRYELIDQLGVGGMGVVWRSRDHTEHTQVALKFLPTVLVLQEREMDRLREEVRAGKGLRHDNIVATYGLEVEDGIAAIVMELVEGQTLQALLEAQPRGFFEPAEIADWASDIAAAVDYLHQQAKRIHRDLKPANIIVSHDGAARLMDFGISQRIQEGVTRHSKSGEAPPQSSATLSYASPQQLKGDPAAPEDDIYSFGALLYDLLTGTPPFYRGAADLVRLQILNDPVIPLLKRRRELVTEGLNASTGQKVPPAVEKMVFACLAKKREQRPTRASQVSQAFHKNITPTPPWYKTKTFQAAAFAAVMAWGAWGMKSGPKEVIKEVPKLVEDTAAKEEAARQKQRADELEKKHQEEEQKRLAAEAQAAKAKEEAAKATMPPPPAPKALPVNDLDAGVIGSSYSVSLPGAVEMSLCFCPSGSYTMGSPASEAERLDDEEQVKVTLTQPFWLAKTELTQAQWVALMGTTLAEQKAKVNIFVDIVGEGPQHPMYFVSTEDADAFIAKLNEKLPLDGWKWVLPTEVQWEYACRAGSTGMWGWTGAGQMGTLEDMGWFEDNAGSATHAVGTKTANAWGLHDMHGNVWERCRDLMDINTKLPGGTNPLGITGYSVIRGGSWQYKAGACRAAVRNWDDATGTIYSIGFRPAAVPAGATVSAGSSALNTAKPRPESTTTTPATAVKDAPFINSLGMKFVPAVTYQDGKNVLFCIWETRSKDYAAFVKATKYDAGTDWKDAVRDKVPVGRGEGESAEESSHPVAYVSHDDAVAFCEWLTKKDRASGLIGPQDEYRLPTDMEWSYAVGIGEKETALFGASASPKEKGDEGKRVKDIYPWGGSFTLTEISGNYADEDAKAKGVETFGVIEGYHDNYATTAPVGSFKANALGLYDMGGNLSEWTSPQGQSGSIAWVLRGASWDGYDASSTLSSRRVDLTSGIRNFTIGFRCVLLVGGLDGIVVMAPPAEIAKPLPIRAQLPPSGYFSLRELFAQTPYADFTIYSMKRILGEAQTLLKREGLYQHQIDTLPGPGTQEALFRWQEVHQVKTSGRLDIPTLTGMNLLNREDERPAGAPAVSAERISQMKGLVGEWVRQGATRYIINVSRVYDNGQVVASYHNPEMGFIPVEAAHILPESSGADFFIKLDTETYNASEYILTLDSNDSLSGDYRHDPNGFETIYKINFDRSR